MEHASYNRHGKLIEDPVLNKVRRITTSALVLIFTFIITNIIFQLLTYLAAKLIGYHVAANFNNILLTRDYHFWNRKRIMAVYLSAPFVCIVLSALFYKILARDRQWVNIARFFIFWLTICLVNIVLSNLAMTPLGIDNYSSSFYNNFGTVVAWLGLGASATYILSGISLVASIAFGIFMGKEVLRFSFSKGLITTQWGKSGVIFQFFIFPVALSIVPLAILGTGSNTARLGLMVANLVLISFGMLIRAAMDTSIVRCNKSDVLNHLPIVEFVFAAGTWAAVFFFLRY